MGLLGLAGICFILLSVYLWIRALAEEDTGNWEKVVYCEECEWLNHPGCAIRIVDDSDKPTAKDFCSFGERKK